MRAKITRKLLDSKEAKEAGEVWDTAERGFYARFRGRDGSVWRYAVKYHISPGKARHHAIAEDGGAIPADICERLGLTPGAAWTPEAARREAERIRGQVRQGQDPDAGRAVPTLRTFAKRYLTDHAVPFKKPRSVEEDEGLLERHLLKDLGDLRLDRIDQAAVTRFAQARKAKPVTANRGLALLSHLYSKAGEWGVVAATMNPARGVPRFKEAKRTRFLSAKELRALGVAIRQLEAEGDVNPFALAAIRLLVFTGARPAEALALRWEHVDLKRGHLNLPDSKTGQKVIHLNPPALSLLSKLPRITGDSRVFPPLKREASEADLESAWKRIRGRAGLEGVRLYDAARHSFASVALGAGASLYLTGALLGHRKASTTERYAHLAADPLKALSADIGGRIASALGERRPPARGRGDVRPMRRTKRG